MEHQSYNLQKTDQKGLASYQPASKMTLPGLTNEENDILALKYKSPRYGKMSDVELLISAKVAIFKIGVITGWPVPSDEHLEVLIDQFTKKLKESYADVNPDELEYAFRSNTTVKDWGKSMNLALIDEILAPYLSARVSVSRLEEQAKKPPMAAIADIPMSDEELLKATFEVYKVVPNYEFIPSSLYNYLAASREIKVPEEEKREIMNIVLGKHKNMPHEARVEQCHKIAVSRYFNQKIKNQQ